MSGEEKKKKKKKKNRGKQMERAPRRKEKISKQREIKGQLGAARTQGGFPLYAGKRGNGCLNASKTKEQRVKARSLGGGGDLTGTGKGVGIEGNAKKTRTAGNLLLVERKPRM